MTILLIIHAFIALALIGVILLQRSEGGGLGLGGGGGSGNLFTARGSANFLTRTTAILATLFIVNCLIMSIIAGKVSREQRSILDAPAQQSQKAHASKDNKNSNPAS